MNDFPVYFGQRTRGLSESKTHDLAPLILMLIVGRACWFVQRHKENQRYGLTDFFVVKVQHYFEVSEF
jgi:hypothetical protein